MISSYLCYDISVALNLHFTSKYDFFKYSGKTRSTKESFNAKPDKYFYERVASRCISEQDCVELIVSNIISNGFKKIYIRNMDYEAYSEYKKRKENIFYNIRKFLKEAKDNNIKNMFFCENEENSYVLNEVLSSNLPLEYFIALDILSKGKILDNHNEILYNDVVWQDLKNKIEKYKPFLEFYWDLCSQENRESLKQVFIDVKKSI